MDPSGITLHEPQTPQVPQGRSHHPWDPRNGLQKEYTLVRGISEYLTNPEIEVSYRKPLFLAEDVAPLDKLIDAHVRVGRDGLVLVARDKIEAFSELNLR